MEKKTNGILGTKLAVCSLVLFSQNLQGTHRNLRSLPGEAFWGAYSLGSDSLFSEQPHHSCKEEKKSCTEEDWGILELVTFLNLALCSKSNKGD